MKSDVAADDSFSDDPLVMNFRIESTRAVRGPASLTLPAAGLSLAALLRWHRSERVPSPEASAGRKITEAAP